MAVDVTTLLVQRILNDPSPGVTNTQEPNADLLSQADSVVGVAANYAQILGTAAGPIAQAAAVPIVGQIAAAQAAGTISAGAAAEATALAGAATAGEAAAIVLVISVVLALISAPDQSSETQELIQLTDEVQEIQDQELANYWQSKFMVIMNMWNSPTGGLGNDLDDLANEGTAGFYVKQDVGQFHGNAQAFVNNLIPLKTPEAEAELYWKRPVVQSETFTAQQVLYPAPIVPGTPSDAPIAIGSTMGWYGRNLPEAQLGTPLGRQPMALDPTTVLPVLLLGLQSYLAIQMLVHVIDKSQPTFSDFVNGYRMDLADYAEFLDSQYELAVRGIVKSEIPASADILSFLYFMAEVVYGASFADNTQWFGGSFPYQGTPGSWPYAGYAWNGIYGVFDVYPSYGVCQPPPPVPVPCISPSCLIDIIDTEMLVSEWTHPFSYAYMQEAVLRDWTIPWLQNKLMLGIMARWKALYLFNGYDKVWSILQNLRALANLPPLVPLTLAEDGTVADGNWHARELCTQLNVDGDISDGLVGDDPLIVVRSGIGGYSLFALLQCLDNIANGSWAQSGYAVAGHGLARPASFRALLGEAGA
jgi:hypothetical protein